VNPLEDALGLSRGGGTGTAGAWWALPSARRPRLLVPCEPVAWPAALQLAGHSSRARLMPAWLRVLRHVRRRPDFTSSATRLEPLLAGFSSRGPFRHAVYLGTASIYAKDTIQCQDALGQVIGYVKIPRGPCAGAAIAAEVGALERLAVHLPQETFFSRLLARHEGLHLHSPPPPGTRQAPGTTEDADSILAVLAERFGSSLTWQESPDRARIAAAIERLAASSHPWQGSLNAAARRLDAAFGTTPLPHVLNHGDFVPWNLRGRFAFDWEWAHQGLAGHDGLHFRWFPALCGRRTPQLKQLLASWNCVITRPDARNPGKSVEPALASTLPLSYLATRLAFYSTSSLENGDSPDQFPFLNRIHTLLCQSVS
jgi:hypothetical protein